MINDDKIKIQREKEGGQVNGHLRSIHAITVQWGKNKHQPVRLGIYLDGPSEEYDACKDSTVHIPAIPDFNTNTI